MLLRKRIALAYQNKSVDALWDTDKYTKRFGHHTDNIERDELATDADRLKIRDAEEQEMQADGLTSPLMPLGAATPSAAPAVRSVLRPLTAAPAMSKVSTTPHDSSSDSDLDMEDLL